jgi:hypothetical protein
MTLPNLKTFENKKNARLKKKKGESLYMLFEVRTYTKKQKREKKRLTRINSALPGVFEVLCHNVQICYFFS